ncbi:hypothetical protein SDC9_190017 [bioreactor metagenome]|uniref:Uncharacterized protein n=1 Tax=bioreactor metagenome TaxID=1076179 RepID=A0A645HUC2_9ZZZZ
MRMNVKIKMREIAIGYLKFYHLFAILLSSLNEHFYFMPSAAKFPLKAALIAASFE